MIPPLRAGWNAPVLRSGWHAHREPRIIRCRKTRPTTGQPHDGSTRGSGGLCPCGSGGRLL